MESGFFVSTKDLIFILIAGYAAVVSTVSLLRGIWHDRRRVRVTRNTSFAVGDHGSVRYLVVEAVNVGYREVKITQVSWGLPNGETLIPGPDPDFVQGQLTTKLPITLRDGGSAQMLLTIDAVRQSLLERGDRGRISIVPHAKDSLGTVHRGRALPLKL